MTFFCYLYATDISCLNTLRTVGRALVIKIIFALSKIQLYPNFMRNIPATKWKQTSHSHMTHSYKAVNQLAFHLGYNTIRSAILFSQEYSSKTLSGSWSQCRIFPNTLKILKIPFYNLKIFLKQKQTGLTWLQGVVFHLKSIWRCLVHGREQLLVWTTSDLMPQ